MKMYVHIPFSMLSKNHNNGRHTDPSSVQLNLYSSCYVNTAVRCPFWSVAERSDRSKLVKPVEIVARWMDECRVVHATWMTIDESWTVHIVSQKATVCGGGGGGLRPGVKRSQRARRYRGYRARRSSDVIVTYIVTLRWRNYDHVVCGTITLYCQTEAFASVTVQSAVRPSVRQSTIPLTGLRPQSLMTLAQQCIC